jgi:hypothetical protein
MKTLHVIILCIVLLLLYTVTERYKSGLHVIFLSKQETIDFFTQDVDGYLEQLSLPDLIAQKANSHETFLSLICNAADDFSLSEKEMCIHACSLADDWIQNKMSTYTGINNKKLANLPWKLSLTRGKANEEGLPHTRKDIIFLSDDVLNLSKKELVRTLIHEKVHVYERLYPQDIELWMKTNGYKRHKRLSEYKLARSNPDVDGWTYINPSGKETIVFYRNENPKGIDDVIYPGPQHPNTEHPYETLAYLIDNSY